MIQIADNASPIKTGLIQFKGQFPCVVIRNDDAIVWAADIRKALKYIDAPQTCEQKLRELAEILESVKNVASTTETSCDSETVIDRNSEAYHRDHAGRSQNEPDDSDLPIRDTTP